ncbi:MAG TPA: ribonuclease E inhibitor RraB [Balneolaceae bacterium]|nr:ribonuclease E inhibitor RraB [Balneolaceae bacterium]
MKPPSDADSIAISKIEDFGLSFEKEQEMEFFFYFPEEHQAYSVAAELSNFHFKASVSYSEHSDQWLCFATKTINATSERLSELRNWFEALAEQHEGEYDGWGTGMILDD